LANAVEAANKRTRKTTTADLYAAVGPHRGNERRDSLRFTDSAVQNDLIYGLKPGLSGEIVS